jgi:transposase-like protein
VLLSNFCSRRGAMPRRPNAGSARRSAIHRIRNPVSSTPISLASTTRRLQQKKGRNPAPSLPTSTGPYLNDILEQDQRAVKQRVKAKQSFREFQAARRMIEGYEPMHMIRKGQARWVSGDVVRQQNQSIDQLFDLAA